jgi:hypothetical protein
VGCAVESFPAPADGDHVIASALERRAEFVGGRQKTWLTVRNRAPFTYHCGSCTSISRLVSLRFETIVSAFLSLSAYMLQLSLEDLI